MGEMVSAEKVLCTSAPWRWFTRKVVLPWALQNQRLSGHGLEIGAGAGMMAAELLSANPDLELTVTDFDGGMLAAAKSRLSRFESRASVTIEDAAELSFSDASFDYVFSFIMLHHVGRWETAIGEAIRVLRPGGWLIGYDLLDTFVFRTFHRLERADERLIGFDELMGLLDSLEVDRVIVSKALFGSVVRFRMRRAA